MKGVWERVAAWGLGLVLAGVLLSAVITTERVDSAVGAIADVVTAPFDSAPSEAERVTDRFFKAVRTEKIWASPPKMLEVGREYFIEHFEELDPRRTHPFRPAAPVLDVHQAATEGTLYARTPVTVVGKVGPSNPLSAFRTTSVITDGLGRRVRLPNLEYASQLGPGLGPPPVLHCRYAEAMRFGGLPSGRWAIVTGLIVANGTGSESSGETSPAAMMACSAVRTTTARQARKFFRQSPHSPASAPKDPLLR